MLSIEGRIINHDSDQKGRIEINPETGLIENVGAPTGQADIIVGEECLIFPGFVDLHVHMREDQSGEWNYKEDFATGSQAAIHGGVAAVMDMTNSRLPMVSEKVYLERKKLADAKSLVNIVLAGSIGPNTKPFSFPVPYKIFMAHSVGELFFQSKAEIEETIKQYQGENIAFHCEDPEILEKYSNAQTHEGKRPPEAEISGIDFALKLIKKYGLYGRICHVSTAEGLERIIEAKKSGLKVTCEVTPHHLYFDNSMDLQMNPPLRAEKDRLRLLEGLKQGEIDFLASDHAPHTKTERTEGISGLPHLDTYGPFTTWLMSEHRYTPKDIARVSSFNPGAYLGHFTASKFGQIIPGFTGSLTILDMSKKTHIQEENLKTKASWSPFTGREFAGSVKYAIIRGRVYEQP